MRKLWFLLTGKKINPYTLCSDDKFSDSGG